MDFEVIDNVLADTLASGDIISNNGDHIQLSTVVDGVDGVDAYGYNLSTGDDWEDTLDPDDTYDIYRSF